MFKWFFGPILITKIDRLGTYAAALAYCIVLSMVPFLALTFTFGMRIASEFAQSKIYAQQYAEVLNEIIPTDNPHGTEKIFEAIQQSSRSGFVALGFILAVYTSFNLMEQIIRTLLFIFDDPRRPQEWNWMRMVKTIALLGIWMLLLLLISITAVEASVLHALLERFLFPTLTQALVKVVQLAVVISALLGTFFLTFSLVPDKRYKRNLVMEGSMLASGAWIASSLVFASILPQILKASAAYIALGSVVATLLWAQACAWSIILGACWIVRFSPRGK
jgi:YihY family inner membrane protein